MRLAERLSVSIAKADGGENQQIRICDHCGRTGHLKSSCWALHGLSWQQGMANQSSVPAESSAKTSGYKGKGKKTTGGGNKGQNQSGPMETSRPSSASSPCGPEQWIQAFWSNY
ncbi:hypothetical protein CRG98_007090 [Punica granatum]|uniref:CCHC-type domain-containing protein n=1 Tax=Punica granatum TaxID=22663 RepID=A0A2I0KVI8_PUNGR|nr:hypothetical protein CRG98_007090 [Punica granatum]